MDATPAIPYRLRVGVTGHRRLPDDPALAAQVRSVLQRILQLVPASAATPVRLIVLSSLAEGADRLVPYEALTIPDSLLEVYLPLPAEQYRTDFETEPSRSAFADLLARAASVTVMPPTRSRTDAYAHAGRAVVERSEVLLALWDGKPARGYGGTGEVVTWARARRLPLFWIETTAPFAVHEELGDSAASSNPARADFTMPAWARRLLPGWIGASARPGSRQAPEGGLALPAFHQIDAFNRAAIDTAQEVRRTQAQLQGLFDVAAESGIAPERIRSFTDWITPYFIRADAPAQMYQRRFQTYGAAFFVFAALWIVTPALLVLFFPGKPQLQLIGLVFIALTWFVGYAGRDRFHLHRHWISYRALAERLRSRLFLALAGVDDLKEQTSEGLSPNLQADEWSLRVFAEAWQARPRVIWSEAEAAGLAHFLAKAWIADQIAYFRHTGGRQRGHVGRLARLTRIGFILGIVVVIVNGFSLIALSGWGKVFLAVSYVVPTVASALNGIGEQRGYVRNAERFARSASVLEVFHEHMKNAPDLATIRAVAAQTEAVLLEESRGWLFIMQYQDLRTHA